MKNPTLGSNFTSLAKFPKFPSLCKTATVKIVITSILQVFVESVPGWGRDETSALATKQEGARTAENPDLPKKS